MRLQAAADRAAGEHLDDSRSRGKGGPPAEPDDTDRRRDQVLTEANTAGSWLQALETGSNVGAVRGAESSWALGGGGTVWPDRVLMTELAIDQNRAAATPSACASRSLPVRARVKDAGAPSDESAQNVRAPGTAIC
jgi:hypothetical protein